jgi:MFS family permease
VFKNKWWLVFGAILALICGNGVINVFASGLFFKPMAKELGFGRGVISSSIAVTNVMTAITAPFLGRLFDKYGVRPVLLPAIVLFAISVAARSFCTSSIVLLFIIFGIGGITGTGQSTTGYSKLIASNFDKERGLALGLTLGGVGLGTFIVPQYAHYLLSHFGWRNAYLGLGALVLVLAFTPAFIFFSGPAAGARKAAAGPRADLPGLEFSEAIRGYRFWAVWFFMFLSTVAVNGSLIQIVPMLTDRGIPVGMATFALSISGIALLFGRVFSGYLMDKIFAPYIGIFFVVLPIIGLGILGLGFHGAGPIVGTVLLGMGMGAELDLLGFIIAVYFGNKAFGALHGFIFMGALFANAVGTAMLGWIYQWTHSYALGFIIFEIILVICVVLLAVLGPYKYPVQRHKQPKLDTAAAVAK